MKVKKTRRGYSYVRKGKRIRVPAHKMVFRKKLRADADDYEQVIDELGNIKFTPTKEKLDREAKEKLEQQADELKERLEQYNEELAMQEIEKQIKAERGDVARYRFGVARGAKYEDPIMPNQINDRLLYFDHKQSELHQSLSHDEKQERERLVERLARAAAKDKGTYQPPAIGADQIIDDEGNVSFIQPIESFGSPVVRRRKKDIGV